MSKIITFNNERYSCENAETLLQAINRNEKLIPHSCKNGLCQTCLLQTTDGVAPASSQIGLKKSLQKKGYFLACTCKPETDMQVSWPNDHDIFGHATVLTKEFISSDICRLTLETSIPLYYHAGQFINLKRSNRVIRSYSLASVPSLDNYLEVHIKRKENGKFSNWIFDRVEPWKNIDIQGPGGECYYRTGFQKMNLLLIGTGTGIAPLTGIARDALNSDHQGDIYVYHGSHDVNGLYLHQELTRMQQDYSQFNYSGCVSSTEVPDQHFRHGRAHDIAFSDHSILDNWVVFMAGLPAMITSASHMAEQAGVQKQHILAESFELNELRLKPRDE